MPKVAMTRLILLSFLLCATGGTAEAQINSQLRNIPASSYTDSATFEFLRPLVTDRQIIGLAESMHMTSEFPLVRIGIVKFLHEQMGFDVVAMEGSAVDFWISQDELLNSRASAADVQLAQQRSFFGLWLGTSKVQTPASSRLCARPHMSERAIERQTPAVSRICRDIQTARI